MAVTIKKDRVLDSWMTIVENGAGNRDRVYSMTQLKLEEAGLPGVTWKRDDVSSGMFGASREFLVVHKRELREYSMFICARDFGQHLDCAWFLTCQPGLFKKAVSKYASGNANAMSMNLDVFNQQDLSAWVHVVHRAFLHANKELMEELKQDITGMNTRSKGYLAVW
jgi:hypothetical protein